MVGWPYHLPHDDDVERNDDDVVVVWLLLSSCCVVVMINSAFIYHFISFHFITSCTKVLLDLLRKKWIDHQDGQ
jgi:hypothetical protein